ncbi:MAG TPA: site-2 protease family protein [Thermoanaerobaculia bacterium]|nr:site-2 protease family protein [Thermoanaerobaculia bacterium]
MPGSVRIARLFGIDINIHFSWLLIFFLVVLNLADSFPQQFPQWSNQKGLLVASITAFLFFGSVLGHEPAHSLVARRFQMSVSSITLFLLGGVANLRKEPPSAKAEFFMAIAGPATSVVIGVVGLGVSFLIDPRAVALSNAEAIQAVAAYLGTVNLYLAAFNMIPGFPLDGGRVLRSIIWAITGDRTRATTIAARGGQVVAVGFGLFVLYEVIVLHEATGLWFGLIAYFLWNAASSSLQQERITSAVGGAKVGPLMSTDFKSTSPGAMVGQVIRDLVLPMNLRAIPVVSGDRLIGLVAIGDLRKVDQSRWAETPVEAVMTPAAELPTVSSDDPLGTALERFGATELPLLPVIKDGHLVGILYRESVIGYVRMQEMLGVAGRR